MKKAILLPVLFCVLTGLAYGADREIKLKAHYLNLPVTYNEDDRTSIEILINGKGEI